MSEQPKHDDTEDTETFEDALQTALDAADETQLT